MDVPTHRSRPLVARRIGLALFVVGLFGYGFTIDGNEPTPWTVVDVAVVLASVLVTFWATRLD